MDEFSCRVSFSEDETDYSGKIEYSAPEEIRLYVESPSVLKGMMIEEANGELRAKLGDAYIELENAEKLLKTGLCFSELFEVLGTLGSKAVELNEDNTASAEYSGGVFKVEFSDNQNVPECIETEDYMFIFVSA